MRVLSDADVAKWKLLVVNVVNQPGRFDDTDIFVRYGYSSNLEQQLPKWRNVWGMDFLPVAAFRIPKEELWNRLRLPRTPWDHRIENAAKVLRNAPVVPDAHKWVFDHIRRIGDRSVPLLNAWQSACAAA